MGVLSRMSISFDKLCGGRLVSIAKNMEDMPNKVAAYRVCLCLVLLSLLSADASVPAAQYPCGLDHAGRTQAEGCLLAGDADYNCKGAQIETIQSSSIACQVSIS